MNLDRPSRPKIPGQAARVLLWGFIVLIVLAGPWARPGWAIRLKDIASFKGVRPNQLIGNGLVVGLNGTGDGTNVDFNTQELANFLAQLGINASRDKLKVKNIAAVAVTAVLPPFARVGSRIDVLVSSLGDAKSLQGGTLLLTPLKGVDGQVYALAQGPVSVGGFTAGGAAGGGVTKNHPTAGRIANGATVEREIPFDFAGKDEFILSLHDSDFTTSQRIVKAINHHLRGSYSHSRDGGTVAIKLPPGYKDRAIPLLASLENLEITPDAAAKVVIDERNGTVVMGANVRLSTVAIAHGNLMVQIKERPRVSQPLPFSEGETVVVPDTSVTIKEGENHLMVLPEGVSIGQVVRALNAIGVTPRDLIAILQAIKAAGALQAELEII
ncbi:MAG: flagellar basal body P-ring protein FlgI [Deltaproteobacteria bacterium]|nr:flagellar basal body P-ring protein FlgI [Deltaproteobacteria bacterium]